MSDKQIISTNNAPQAIGTYSQAVKVGNTVYLSGQIPLIPETMEMIEGGITEQATQVFKNLSAVAEAAGGTLNDAAKVNISLVDLSVFAQVNEVMAQFFAEPYPARACVQVAALPRNALIEVEVILSL
ncbi:RidA family protein [Spongiibacter sp. KMU-158]|uniref:RidA family protein n=1 Tax=Spongiibacter pelagi TaxID=2760804 RepID=A0A927GUN4_9GAMM|nr:RidA family protein [Spongiibacter pelagi]MBD2857525.1 RidA family protein [Spongiibacter pelagi]